MRIPGDRAARFGLPATVLSCLLASLVPVHSQATNGYFSHGFGTRSKGIAGAGSAAPHDALSSVVNPAGVAHVGTRLDLGAGLFMPQREYSQAASGSIADPMMPPLPIGSQADFTGTVESDKELFVIPHVGYARTLGERDALGFAIYGNGGMNTTYRATDTTMGFGTFGDGTDAGVDLIQLFANLRYARRVNDQLTLGGGILLAGQRFNAKGLSNLGVLVADGNPDALSNNGNDYSYGAGLQLGALWSPSEQWSLGLSYQTRIYMGEFDRYADLFAEQGDFDIPETATLGLAYAPSEDWRLLFDLQYIGYSDIPSLGNAMTSKLVECFGGVVDSCLGGNDGAGYGWDDMFIYKFGLEWKLDPNWTLRGGYSFADNPVPTSGVLFNVLAPAVIEEHFTLGLTRQFGARHELSASLMHAPENDMNCGCTLPMTGGPESINIAMQQWEFELSWAWRW
jgi:long-chain fatty acid transport protein